MACMRVAAVKEVHQVSSRGTSHLPEYAEQPATSPNQEASPASVSTLDGKLGPLSIFERMSSSASPSAFSQVSSPAALSPRKLPKNNIPELQEYTSSTTSSPTTFTFVAHDGSEGHGPARTHGGRKGALAPATLKKSREVRRVGACWNCWVMKMPVCCLFPQTSSHSSNDSSAPKDPLAKDARRKARSRIRDAIEPLLLPILLSCSPV